MSKHTYTLEFAALDGDRLNIVGKRHVRPVDVGDRLDRALSWVQEQALRFAYIYGPGLMKHAINELSVNDIRRRLGLPVQTTQPPNDLTTRPAIPEPPAHLLPRKPEQVDVELPRRASRSGRLIGLAWVRMNDEYRMLKLFETEPGYAPEIIKVRRADEPQAWSYIRTKCAWPHCGIWIGCGAIDGAPGLVWGPPASDDVDLNHPTTSNSQSLKQPNLAPFRRALGNNTCHNEAVRYTPRKLGETSPQFAHADRAYPHIRSTRSAHKFRWIRSRYWIPDYVLLDYLPMEIIRKCFDLRKDYANVSL